MMNKEERIIKNILSITPYDYLQKLTINQATEIIVLKQRINDAIEILKLCNSKCAKETIEILGGKE